MSELNQILGVTAISAGATIIGVALKMVIDVLKWAKVFSVIPESFRVMAIRIVTLLVGVGFCVTYNVDVMAEAGLGRTFIGPFVTGFFIAYVSYIAHDKAKRNELENEKVQMDIHEDHAPVYFSGDGVYYKGERIDTPEYTENATGLGDMDYSDSISTGDPDFYRKVKKVGEENGKK